MSEPSPTLLALGLAPEESGLLALLPLIEVAWADGVVQPAERTYILKCAEERMVMTPHGREVLQGWLSWRPSETTFAHGRFAVSAWAREGHFPEHFDLRELGRGLARAAGGVMGVGAVDPREQEVLDRLASVLERGMAEAPTVYPFEDEEDDEPDTDIGPISAFAPGDWQRLQPDADHAVLVRVDGEEVSRTVLTGSKVSLGRSRTCDLQLRADGQISRTHCNLVRREDGWFVEDLGSANGTHVNGERVRTRRLVGGEQLRVGSAVLIFVAARG